MRRLHLLTPFVRPRSLPELTSRLLANARCSFSTSASSSGDTLHNNPTEPHQTGDAAEHRSKIKKVTVFHERATIARLDATDPSIGITYVDGKRFEIFGVLPGEEVSFSRPAKKNNGTLVEVLRASEHRAQPKCSVYGRCGGCSLMHMTHEMQLEVKHNQALDALQQEGVVPAEVLPPLRSKQYGYRHSARPNVRHLPEREGRVGGKVVVGFRHKWFVGSQPVDKCEVLADPLSTFFQDAAAVINRLSVRDKVPNLEVMMGDTEKGLLLRHLAPLRQEDKELLIDFARSNGFHFYTQSEGLPSIQLLYSPTGFTDPSAPTYEPPQSTNSAPAHDPFAKYAHYLRPKSPATSDKPFSPLFYSLPKHDVKIHFAPGDFIQVNSEVNRQLVDQAIDFLALTKKDRVLDLFCGLGNFTLPTARYAKSVTGVEWATTMVEKARTNALVNGLSNVEFHADDLAKPGGKLPWLKSLKVNKLVVDPPRSGALMILKLLMEEHALQPERIVYVSCNPTSMARDIAYLQTKGYAATKMRTADMFPNTDHIESIALLEKTRST